jgi:photosystem II stability/assembly factor-like uncharacterized protein
MGTFTLTGVTYDAGEEAPHVPLWVAVGRDGRVLHASDAITWTEYQMPPNESSDYWDVSFGKDGNGDDLWAISTSTTPELRLSSDPTAGIGSWSSIDFTGTADKSRTIEYGANGTWIAGTKNSNVVLRSTDGGVTWTKITAVPASVGQMTCMATDGNGTWVIGGINKTIKSYDDGLNWYESLSGGGQINGVEYNNGVWFLASNSNTSYRATAILNNTNTDNWVAVSGISVPLWAICHITGNTWMTAGKGDTPSNPFLSTDNCASWSAVTSPSAGQIMGLASDGTTVVVGGKDSKIHTSTDNGSTWTLRYTVPNYVDVLVIDYNKVKPY